MLRIGGKFALARKAAGASAVSERVGVSLPAGAYAGLRTNARTYSESAAPSQLRARSIGFRIRRPRRRRSSPTSRPQPGTGSSWSVKRGVRAEVSARSPLVASSVVAGRHRERPLRPLFLFVARAKRYPRLVASDFEGEVDRRDDRAPRLDVDAYGRDRVCLLLVDAFDAGEVANDRVGGGQGRSGRSGLAWNSSMPRRSAYSTSAPRTRISAEIAQIRAAHRARVTSRFQFGLVLASRAIVPVRA
jgi:hypothetical protein